MFLFFDCETTGLPKNWRAPMQDVNNWPRVIQLAWLLTDREGKEMSRGKHLIKPHGWVVPKEKFWLDNGFTTELCDFAGRPIMEALGLFIECVDTAEAMISHNMAFDYNVVGAECIRADVKAAHKPKRYCTKEMSTYICKLPFEGPQRGGGQNFKWPKLSELHRFLFQHDFDGAHDALADVIALRECFFELLNRKLIQL